MNYTRKDALNSRYWIHLVFLFILIILTFLAYSNVLHGGLIFDDESYLFENIMVKSPQAYRDFGFWDVLMSGTRPVANFTFSLNYYFFGKDTFSYHVTNIAIHILNGILVYILVYKTLKTSELRDMKFSNLQTSTFNQSNAQRIAFMTSLLFLIHPIQTESVSYIIQRQESLSSFFYLVSLIAFILAAESRLKVIWLMLFVLSIVLALGSKEIAITVPVMAFLYGIYFFDKKDLWKKLALPGLLIFAGLVIAYLKVMSVGGEATVGYGLKRFTALEYLYTQFNGIVTYLRLLVLPVGQNIDHDYPISRSFFEARTMISFTILSFLMSLSVILFDRWRAGSFFILWFFIILSPTSSILPIRDVFVEHRLYLPSLGIFFILATGGVKFSEILKKRLKRKLSIVISIFLFISIAAALWTATYKRNLLWNSKLAMWQDVTRKAPDNPRAWSNLANTYLLIGDYKRAIRAGIRSITISPGYMETYWNIGKSFEKLGMRDIARDFFVVFVRFAPVWYAEDVKELTFKYNIKSDERFSDIRLKQLSQRGLDALDKFENKAP